MESKTEQDNFIVLYNKVEDRIFCMPDYLVCVSDGVVHLSNPWAIWRSRSDLIILGEL